jgi:hypothetical protein
MAEDIYASRDYRRVGVETQYLCETLSGWLLEASVLPSNICLVFDGDPAPAQASKIFEEAVVQRAIWQDALEECFARGLGRQVDEYLYYAVTRSTNDGLVASFEEMQKRRRHQVSTGCPEDGIARTANDISPSASVRPKEWWF